MSEAHGRVVGHDQVLETALRSFVETGRLDMQELAQQLAVSRATLYRVVSSRERLLGEILWSLAELSLQSATRKTTGDMNLDRLLLIGSIFRDSALSSEPFKTFVQAEPSTAAAALFTPGEARRRVWGDWRSLLVQAIETQGGSLTIDASSAAEIIVSLGASMLYADLVTGHHHDTDLVAVVLRSLFDRA